MAGELLKQSGSPGDGATLVTGASGFLGSLSAAALLAEERRRLLLPVRATADPAGCLARMREALLDYGLDEQYADELLRLVTVVELPSIERLSDLDSAAARAGVDEVIHCAGCVDYFDTRRLQLANVDLTARLLQSASRWGVRRFFYVSSAYCSGYRSGVIPESLHPDPAPADEPTEYTRTKRLAERLIADSGIPFVIIRPSVVIGDSRTGKYTGKNYGIYQMWRAIEGLLCREYYPIWYTVAPATPVDLIHQDAFQAGFMGAYRSASANAIVHLVGNPATNPTMRELCWLWADVYNPLEIRSYARVDDVPLHTIPIRQRRFLEIAAKNLEISTQTWQFERRFLDSLIACGLAFADVTVETVARCQQRYIEGSTRIQEHMKTYGHRLGEPPRLIEVTQAESHKVLG